MFSDSKKLFIIAYNQKVPKWKKITQIDLINDRNLDRILDSINLFIQNNKLDPKILVNSVISHFFKKNNRYPSIFLFKSKLALSIYKNYELASVLDLSETQKIINFVKKSKKLQKNLEVCGIIYSRGVNILKDTKKASPYYLLAHGITDGISEECIKKWSNNNELKDLVLNIILNEEKD